MSILHYFDGPTKLFSDLYLAKFLNISAKPFFPYISSIVKLYILYKYKKIFVHREIHLALLSQIFLMQD